MTATPRVGRALTAAIAVAALVSAAVRSGSSPQPALDAVAIAVAAVVLVALAVPSAGPRVAAAVELLAVAACGVVPALAAGRLDSARDGTGAWWVTAVACIAVLLLLRGRRVLAGVGIAALVLHTVVRLGPTGVVGFGVAAAGLLVALAGVASWAAGRAGHDRTWHDRTWQDRPGLHEPGHEGVAGRAARDAHHAERQVRLRRARRVASTMLERIATGRPLTDAERAECLLLEQTMRDEVRGRILLNDTVRAAVMAARRRGAVVQVLDDGGLDDLPGEVLDGLRDEVAAALAPLDSTRIVVRTAPAGSAQAITVVATTVDPVAAALGLDEADEVDLWLALDRPVPAG